MELAKAMAEVHTVFSFPYNGDLTAPHLVKHVYPFFDEIVIIEARETMSGNPKAHMFYEKNASQFRRCKDKITILRVDAFPAKPVDWEPYAGMPMSERDAWFREFYQRDIVQSYLAGKFKKYVLCCCDADEFPHPQHLLNLRENYNHFDEPKFLGMKVFYYNLHWAVKGASWSLPFICNDQCLVHKTPTGIRVGERGKNKIILPEGGWHCTFFFSVADIIRKLESYPHRELDRDCIKDPKYIKDCISNGIDILSPLKLESFRGEIVLEKTRPSTLPEALQLLNEEVVLAQKK